ncbi:Thionin [Trema orientale]|uniref:Thionin n=1 Tax=Trema orientale TaxID=63057 RepID=A0A2P5D3W4_TREOI|nr:Thionin [Trema orientale]
MANRNIKIPAVLIMSVLFIGAFFQTGEALTPCAKECMPVCLKEDGATIPVCETACESYCKQAASGSGQGGGGIMDRHH